jgi:hypothetical protein
MLSPPLRPRSHRFVISFARRLMLITIPYKILKLTLRNPNPDLVFGLG